MNAPDIICGDCAKPWPSVCRCDQRREFQERERQREQAHARASAERSHVNVGAARPERELEAAGQAVGYLVGSFLLGFMDASSGRSPRYEATPPALDWPADFDGSVACPWCDRLDCLGACFGPVQPQARPARAPTTPREPRQPKGRGAKPRRGAKRRGK